ncbi:MAG: YcgN family cysteine cluster protein, partial [Hyphomicrobiales bacterium]|nr:YcgN family cysteine cluster protein [Hyphomicrobiales bacterium]
MHQNASRRELIAGAADSGSAVVPARGPADAATRKSGGEAAKDEDAPFWRTKTLDEMSASEWESLCDGCGRCCLVKLEDEDDGEIHFTDIGCKLLDAKTCRCLDYKSRHRRVPDCVKLTPQAVRSLSWLPVTCAYRLVAEGKDLFDWHPLVSGSADSVHEAGVS